MVWFHWFLNHEFKLQISVSNGCQDLTMLCLYIVHVASTTDKVKVFITIVLFIALANMKPLMYEKDLYLMTMDNIYIYMYIYTYIYIIYIIYIISTYIMHNKQY